jgi:biopolymer transport protein ExbB
MIGFVEMILPLAQAAADTGNAVEHKSYLQILVWPGGGTIGLVLWCLSIVMLALVIRSLLLVRRMNIMPELPHAQLQEMFNNKQFREAIDVSANEPSMFSQMVHAALAEAPRGYANMERALEDAAEDRTVRLLREVEWLNLLGNVGPMMGLLGTVWGMILAFFNIVEAGTVNASMLAGALGVKLVCTLVGLIVAIPSLSVYGIARNKIDMLSSEAVTNAQELISTFRPGKKAE